MARSRAAWHRAVRSLTVAVLSGDGSEEEDGEEEAVGSSDVLREKAGSEHRPEVVADPARVAAWATYWSSCEPKPTPVGATRRCTSATAASHSLADRHTITTCAPFCAAAKHSVSTRGASHLLTRVTLASKKAVPRQVLRDVR